MTVQNRSGPPPSRRGYSMFEVISAVQKSVRRSQVREAVFWTMEAFESGHQVWTWNRLEEICVEDVGPADPHLIGTVHALREISDSKRAKGKGGGMEATLAAILLASAAKSRLASLMVMEQEHAEPLEVADEALDQHTRRGRRMGRGLRHFYEEAAKTEPPTEDLAALETEYRERAVARAAARADNEQPDHISHMKLGRLPGQLPLDEEQR